MMTPRAGPVVPASGVTMPPNRGTPTMSYRFAFIALAIVAAAAGAADGQTADIILTNGVVYTVDDHRPVAEVNS